MASPSEIDVDAVQHAEPAAATPPDANAATSISPPLSPADAAEPNGAGDASSRASSPPASDMANGAAEAARSATPAAATERATTPTAAPHDLVLPVAGRLHGMQARRKTRPNKKTEEGKKEGRKEGKTHGQREQKVFQAINFEI